MQGFGQIKHFAILKESSFWPVPNIKSLRGLARARYTVPGVTIIVPIVILTI